MESCTYLTNTRKDFVLDAIELSERMLLMAEKGIRTCEDDSCLLLYGIIRDCGYKIRRTVEEERVSCPLNGKNQKVLN